MTTTLSIFFKLVFAEENYVKFIIKKPEWCNSTSLVYYYTILEVQKEYKYPCASYIDKNIYFFDFSHTHLNLYG
jgi:hypothetical protein